METVLVCDDERDIVNALRIYLESEGYRVVPAYSGREAVELLRHESVQLVLLDLTSPGVPYTFLPPRIS